MKWTLKLGFSLFTVGFCGRLNWAIKAQLQHMVRFAARTSIKKLVTRWSYQKTVFAWRSVRMCHVARHSYSRLLHTWHNAFRSLYYILAHGWSLSEQLKALKRLFNQRTTRSANRPSDQPREDRSIPKTICCKRSHRNWAYSHGCPSDLCALSTTVTGAYPACPRSMCAFNHTLLFLD